MRWRLFGILLCLYLVSLALGQRITIRMMGGAAYGIPPKEATDTRSLARRAVFEQFHRENPDIQVVNAGGLELQGDNAEDGFLMSMAGDTPPDVFYVNFREYYKFIDEGFCRPLDDLIRATPNSLERVNPTVLGVLKSYDGHIYAMPWFQVALALYYRRDLFAKAGLDPARPPRTWEEFYSDGQRLVESQPGLYGFAFSATPNDKAYLWTDFLWQAGGEVVVPTPSGAWKAAVATSQAATALDFYRKLTTRTWTGRDGKVYGPVAAVSSDANGLKRSDKLGMWFDYTSDVVLTLGDINPARIGIAAMPAGPAGSQNEINAGMWAINASLKDPKRIAACWKFVKFFASEEAAKINTQRFVELGLGSLCNPVYLKKFGYSDLLSQVDPQYVRANESLFEHGHPEPYGRNCEQVYMVLGDALDRARLEQTDSLQILRDVAKEMDERLLSYTPPEVIRRQRQWATGILVFIGIALCGLLAWGWRITRRKNYQLALSREPMGKKGVRARGFVALCTLPAIASIFVWAYLPLARGLAIAFQDYHVMRESHWVGPDNFIAVFTRPTFYHALGNSFLYVGLTVLLGFFLPIFLAIALDEIPVGKSFFRTVYYLPAMTSGVVIALLWRQLYDRGPDGLLNSLLAPFIDGLNRAFAVVHGPVIARTHDWLGDPSLAMFAVVLPGIWAAAGPGSILYLAALKNIPQEHYEAADLDGAAWFQKIRSITFPALKPLILINLLGVFIGGFKAFENVFLLTGGGPLDSTRTVGLEIWQNAFMFLKFGYATAAAWVMGSILVGFTMLQVRSLMRMRFTNVRV